MSEQPPRRLRIWPSIISAVVGVIPLAASWLILVVLTQRTTPPGVLLYGGPFLVEALVIIGILLAAMLKPSKRLTMLRAVPWLVWAFGVGNYFVLCGLMGGVI